MAQAGGGSQKLCFVTIGATAAFDSLIKAVLSPEFIGALEDAGFSRLLVQYGQEGRRLFEECSLPSRGSKDHRVQIDGFDFDPEGLSPYMAAARDGGGAVISHAGTCSRPRPVLCRRLTAHRIRVYTRRTAS